MTVEVVPPPNLILSRLEELAACLCAQIEKDGSPPTCFCGVIPGDAAVGDYAGDCDIACGMAWVRLMNAYPASGIGQPNEQVGNCSSEIGFEVEVGIMRCIEISEDGGPLPDSELLASAALQTADAQTMRRAIMCCLSSKDFVLGGYTPMGPMGGLVGGTWSLATVV